MGGAQRRALEPDRARPGVLGTEQLRAYYARSAGSRPSTSWTPRPRSPPGATSSSSRPNSLEALAALERLHSSEASWDEVIRVLEKKRKVVESAPEKIDVLMQIAAIWEQQLGNKTEAAGAYLEILDLDQAYMPAHEALETIYRETEAWGELIELYLRQVEIFDDAKFKVSTYQKMAKVFEENQGDPDNAFEVLKYAFNIDYANEDTSRELERLATQANKWGELLNEYNGIVRSIPDKSEQAELWVKIGRWYGEHLNRVDYGLKSLEEALKLNANNINALREQAGFYRRAMNNVELAKTLARIVPLETDPNIQIRTLTQLAEVRGRRARRHPGGDRELPQGARDRRREHQRARRSGPAAPEPGPVAGPRRRARAARRHRSTSRSRSSPCARIGGVQEGRLGDAAAAIETYRSIVDSEPGDREALAALERLYLAGGNVPQYLGVLRGRARHHHRARRADRDLRPHGGRRTRQPGRRTRRGRPRRCEKILLLDKYRDSTYRQLEDLYTRLEKWTELVETYRNHIAVATAPAAKVDLLVAMAPGLREADPGHRPRDRDLQRDPRAQPAALRLCGHARSPAGADRGLAGRAQDVGAPGRAVARPRGPRAAPDPHGPGLPGEAGPSSTRPSGA